VVETSGEPLGNLLKLPQIAYFILFTQWTGIYISSASKPFPYDGVTGGTNDSLKSSNRVV